MLANHHFITDLLPQQIVDYCLEIEITQQLIFSTVSCHELLP